LTLSLSLSVSPSLSPSLSLSLSLSQVISKPLKIQTLDYLINYIEKFGLYSHPDKRLVESKRGLDLKLLSDLVKEK
jgi:hypothetical protein